MANFTVTLPAQSGTDLSLAGAFKIVDNEQTSTSDRIYIATEYYTTPGGPISVGVTPFSLNGVSIQPTTVIASFSVPGSIPLFVPAVSATVGTDGTVGFVYTNYDSFTGTDDVTLTTFSPSSQIADARLAFSLPPGTEFGLQVFPVTQFSGFELTQPSFATLVQTWNSSTNTFSATVSGGTTTGTFPGIEFGATVQAPTVLSGISLIPPVAAGGDVTGNSQLSANVTGNGLSPTIFIHGSIGNNTVSATFSVLAGEISELQIGHLSNETIVVSFIQSDSINDMAIVLLIDPTSGKIVKETNAAQLNHDIGHITSLSVSVIGDQINVDITEGQQVAPASALFQKNGLQTAIVNTYDSNLNQTGNVSDELIGHLTQANPTNTTASPTAYDLTSFNMIDAGHVLLVIDHVDTVANTSQLSFTTMDLNQVFPATTVQQEDLGLYMALYGRAAEFPGYSFWIGTVAQQPDGGGVTVANAASTPITLNDAGVLGQAFVNTQATFFNQTYASLNDSQFINALYVNIGGNAGDPDGIAFWANLLAQAEAGGQSVQAARAGLAGQFVHDLIDVNLTNFTSLTPAQLLAAEHRQETINDKIAVSLAYSIASQQPGGAILIPQAVGDAAYQASAAVLQGVTFDLATVTAAIIGINNAVAHQDLTLI